MSTLLKRPCHPSRFPCWRLRMNRLSSLSLAASGAPQRGQADGPAQETTVSLGWHGPQVRKAACSAATPPPPAPRPAESRRPCLPGPGAPQAHSRPEASTFRDSAVETWDKSRFPTKASPEPSYMQSNPTPAGESHRQDRALCLPQGQPRLQRDPGGQLAGGTDRGLQKNVGCGADFPCPLTLCK